MSGDAVGRVRRGLLIDVNRSGDIVEVVPRSSIQEAGGDNNEILANEFPKVARKVGGGFRLGCTFVTDAAMERLIELYRDGVRG